MKNLSVLLAALLFPFVGWGNALALSLSEAYEAALQNDPFFQMAGFAQQAGMEEKNLGRSQILPEMALSVRKNSNKAERVTSPLSGPSYTEQFDYKSSVTGVYLRQPLINLEKYANYHLGEIRSASADMQYLAAKQEMIVRTVTAFLDVVAAKQALELSKVEKNAIAEQHEQAKRFYASGEGTVTDIDEAKARLDLAVVQEMEANDSYLLNLSILGQLTARNPDRLPEFAANFVKDSALAESRSPEDWVRRAMDNNFELAGKRLAVEAAEQDLLKARSGYFPSVDLVASISRSDQESLTTINQNITNRVVGVELMWPLVKGGYYAALIRQSEAKLQQARQDIEATKIRIRVDVSRQYRDAENGYAKVEARANAVRSNEKAIESVSMGFKAGTRTSVDILNAKKDWIKARKDYVDSMHDFIIARFKLESAAGSLDESLVHWAEKYLVSSVPY